MVIGPIFVGLALVTLCYCAGKTVGDWKARDTWSIVAGAIASLGALIFFITMAVYLLFGSFSNGAYP